MNCRKYLELISLYLDREIDQLLIEELEEHLSLCENCLNLFNTLSKTIDLSRNYYKKKYSKVPKTVSTMVIYQLRLIYRKKH